MFKEIIKGARMNRETLINGILNAEANDDGIGLLDLGPVPNFEKIKEEVNYIIEHFNASYMINDDSFRPYIKDGDDDLKARIDAIAAKYGKPNKTADQIRGMNRVYKLYRESPGWFEDCKDYVKYGGDASWQFWYKDEFPNINDYVSSFSHLVRFWINGLMPGTGFVPHREILTWNWKNKPVIIPRIHVPFIDDPTSVFNVNGYNYNLKEGHAYFLNIGSYHYAVNNSNISRYHFLIDALLDEKLLEMLQNGKIPEPFSYTGKADVDPVHNKRSEISAADRTVDKIFILP